MNFLAFSEKVYLSKSWMVLKRSKRLLDIVNSAAIDRGEIDEDYLVTFEDLNFSNEFAE